MKDAVYDNPATMCREAWQDGQVIASITADLMATKHFEGHRNMPFMLNCGRDFVLAQIHGDIEAVRQGGDT